MDWGLSGLDSGSGHFSGRESGAEGPGGGLLISEAKDNESGGLKLLFFRLHGHVRFHVRFEEILANPRKNTSESQ